MFYIPFQYDGLMQAAILLLGCLAAAIVIVDGRKRCASAGQMGRRFAWVVVGVLVALTAYTWQVLMRQAHEKAESVRQRE